MVRGYDYARMSMTLEWACILFDQEIFMSRFDQEIFMFRRS